MQVSVPNCLVLITKILYEEAWEPTLLVKYQAIVPGLSLACGIVPPVPLPLVAHVAPIPPAATVAPVALLAPVAPGAPGVPLGAMEPMEPMEPAVKPAVKLVSPTIRPMQFSHPFASLISR